MSQVSEKVFCIGLNKTGTTSLHEAFQILGLRSWHDSYQADALINAAIQGNYRLLHYLDSYDAFSDYPFFRYYKELDMQNPGSKFILNTRNLDEWLASRIKHDQAWNSVNPSKPARIIDRQSLSNFFMSVESDIKSYFQDRSNDLVIFNPSDGDSWGKLCSFLDLDEPDIAFPHMNESQT